MKSLTLSSQLFFVQLKNKVKWKCCTVSGTQENRAQSHPFLWLDYGTGGRKPSLSTSAEKWLHASCGWWNESVNSRSETHVRPPLPPYIFERYRKDLRFQLPPCGGCYCLYYPIVLSDSGGLEKCVLHLWQKTLYLFHPHIFHSSSQKFAIILKRHFQTRLTQLWFSVGWDYFALFFFKLGWPFSFHPSLVYKDQSWTTHLFPFTLHLLLSPLVLDSWPYTPIWYLHLPLSLCQPTSFSTGLHFLLQAAWTLTSCPVFSCTNSSDGVSYIDLAEHLHTKSQYCRISPANYTWVACIVQALCLGKENYLTKTMAEEKEKLLLLCTCCTAS